jgi:nucleotidyltransferase/DNA polymerase involved in DNA repair
MPTHATQPKRPEPNANLVLPVTARSGSTIAALWLADPPSWAMERLDPKLMGRPVILTEGPRVIGANTLARKAGVRPLAPVGKARGLCPEAAFVPFEPALVKAAWDMAISSAYQLTPYLEAIRQGLLLLGGITPLEAEALGADQHARVGLAGSRGTAILAALATGDGHARAVGDELKFLEQVPIYLLRGAGIQSEVIQRLELFGLKTLGEIKARVTLKQLAAQFGEVATKLWSLATGLDTRPISVYAPPAELTAQFEFEVPALEPHEWMPGFELAVHRAVRQLGSGLNLHDRLAGTVTVSVNTVLGSSSAQRVFKDYTRDEKTIRTTAHQALQMALQPELEVLTVRVALGDLLRPKSTQDSLFAILERADVREAVRKVHSRFPDQIGRLELHRPHAPLPEQRFRFSPMTGEENLRAKQSGKASVTRKPRGRT